MRGKRLTKEEKKDRCNYCLSKILKFKTDELNYENFNFIKDNSYNIDCYVFKKNINYNAEKEILKVLDEVFAECEHKETGDNLELLRTMFLIIMMFGTINFHKRNMIGVVLKSMITDVVNAFKDFKAMWLKEIDDSVVRLEEQL